MTVLLTADLHLNDLPRDAYRHDWMANILPALLKKHKAELLVIAGDVSDEKDRLSAWLVNQTVDHLNNLTQICPVIVLKGNHDYVVADNPFYEFLGKIEGITWISEPCDAFQVGGPLGHAFLLPHTANYKRDWEHLNLDDYDLIIAHQTFQGAQVGPRKMEGIPTNIFTKDALVFSGDIHEPQTIDDMVIYCGSPFTVDFGDSFDPRVIALDPVALTYKSIPSPGPQKRLVEFAYPNRKIDRPWTDYFKCKAEAGDILKVRITIDAAQAPQWNQIKDDVKAWGADNGFIIYLVQPQVVTAGVGGMAKRKTVTRTDEQLLETYAKSRAVSETTLSTGMKLMGKV